MKWRNVIDLGQSSPHYVAPREIVAAGVSALESGLTKISSPRGVPEFRQAMATKLAAHNGLTADPDGDILVTPGSKQGLYYAINSPVRTRARPLGRGAASRTHLGQFQLMITWLSIQVLSEKYTVTRYL